MLLGEDIGLNGGVFRVTDGLQKRFGAERVVDTPLRESGIIGTSIGLAMAGMRPVPEIQFEGFLGPAYDQIVNQAARCRTRTRGAFTCPMTVRVPVGGGIHAPELHSDSPEAIYAHTPGLKVVMPSRPYDAKGLLISAIRDPDPVIFFEPKRVYRSFREEVPEEEYTIPIGKAAGAQRGDGRHGDHLGRDGVRLPGGDRPAAGRSERRVDRPADDLSDGYRDDCRVGAKDRPGGDRPRGAARPAGLGAEISSLIQEHCFLYLEAPVQRVTGFDTVMPYYKLEKHICRTRSESAGRSAIAWRIDAGD